MADVEQELDRLYGLPLEEFTGARNELAARLKKEGDAEAAADVRALAKPPVSAWLVNLLARREREGVRRLLDAGERLRRAQAEALGGGSPDELREASAAQRKAARELVRRAGELAEETGKPASRTILDRVEKTLSAAAVDEEGRRLLEPGRLERDFEQTGFEALGSVSAAEEPVQDELADRRRRREADRDRVRSLKTEVRELERGAKDAEREAEAARRAAEAARREVERLEAAAEAAARRADEEAERAERAAAELEAAEERLRSRRGGRASS